MTDGKTPAYLAAMRRIREEQETQEQAAQKARKQKWAKQRLYGDWLTLWQRFEPNLIAYLKGESSDALVADLCELNRLIEILGFGSNVDILAENPLPSLSEASQRQEIAICELVIGVWATLRADGDELGILVARLDEITKRLPMEDVSFVRPVIEVGGLRECPQCGRQMGPTEMEKTRCRDCVVADRQTMRWLGIAIACIDKYGSESYGDIDSHFPEWRRWRFRLAEHLAIAHVNRRFTDFELWQWWLGYAHDYLGIRNEQFLGTLREEAAKLLPPVPNDRSLPRKQGRPKSGHRSAETEADQKEWEKIYREYEDSRPPSGFVSKRQGRWTRKFEAFWESRDDLQAWTMEAVWKKVEAARRRIDRRSR